MPRQPRAHVLAIGFGTTVAIWVLAYLALMQPGLLMGEVIFGLMLVCMLAGGFVAGRYAQPRWTIGLKTGFVAAAVNLLLVGSLVGAETAREMIQAAIWWVPGTFIVSIGLSAIGAAVGAAFNTSPSETPGREKKNWLGAFAIVAAAAMFLLLITGGLVTGLEAGLAVPDWPNSYGHNMILYPLAEMMNPERRDVGVHYEHAHRLYGMLVGLTTITLTAALWRWERRPWVRWMCTALLAMVCVQGFMGGQRVIAQSLPLAMIHGVFGQIVFATMVALAAVLSTTWQRARSDSASRAGREEPPIATHGDCGPRLGEPGGGWSPLSATMDRMIHPGPLPILLVAALVVQLILGALYRHIQEASGIHPAIEHGVLTLHIVIALAVTILVIFAAGRAWGRSGLNEENDVARVLRRIGAALIAILSLQLLLGIAAVMLVFMGRGDPSPWIGEVVVTTAHQATGALLLAAATLLAVWSGEE